MRAIVIGCTVFIGSHVAERLMTGGRRRSVMDAFTPNCTPGEARPRGDDG